MRRSPRSRPCASTSHGRGKWYPTSVQARRMPMRSHASCGLSTAFRSQSSWLRPGLACSGSRGPRSDSARRSLCSCARRLIYPSASAHCGRPSTGASSYWMRTPRTFASFSPRFRAEPRSRRWKRLPTPVPTYRSLSTSFWTPALSSARSTTRASRASTCSRPSALTLEPSSTVPRLAARCAAASSNGRSRSPREQSSLLAPRH